MAQNDILIEANAHFSLQSATPVLFEIEEGKIADLYYVERLPDGIGRRLFLFEFTGPLAICSFPYNDLADIMVTSLGKPLSLKKWTPEEFANQGDTAAKVRKIETGVLQMLNEFPDFIEPPGARFIDDNNLDVKEKTNYLCGKDYDLRWITNFPKDTMFNNDLDVDRFKGKLFPIAKRVLYQFKNPGKLKLLSTDQIVNSPEMLRELAGFGRLLAHYFGRDYLAATHKKYQQVKTGYYSHLEGVESSLNHLGTIVTKTGVKEDLKLVNKFQHVEEERKAKHPVQEKGLLDVCKVIGKYEKITFRAGFKSAKINDDPLKSILRASNIRARRVHLANNWWENNHGALMGTLLEDGNPVALIPKGNNAYIMHDLKNKIRVKVDAEISGLLSPTAQSFFTPLPKGTPSPMDLLKFALQFTSADIVVFFIIGIIGALLSLLIPLTTGYIFNYVIPGGVTNQLLNLGFLLLSAVIVIGFMNFTKSLSILRFEGKSSYKLQSALWDRILSLKVPFFSLYNPGDLAERSLGIEKIRTTLSANVMGAVTSGIFSISYLCLMFYYDTDLALLALALGCVVGIFTVIVSMLAYKHVANLRRMEAIISGFMMMTIRGICKIRLTDSKDKVFAIWAEKFAAQKDHYAKKQKLLIVASIFQYGFPIFASICIYVRINTLLTTTTDFQIGDFIAFNTAYLSFQGALIQTFMVTVPMLTIKPTYELFTPIMKAEVEDYDDKTDPGNLYGGIEIKNLKFKYKDSADWILKNVNLSIKPGEFVALAGSSGSGKSTLLRILIGFEHYNEGSVMFDNNELRNMDVREIRDQLGVVLQNGKIMQGTVLYNIIGTGNYTEEDAWEAARNAGIAKDIEEMPLKMHNILPPGGGNMSGGQQQRLIIARALVRKPKILIFDEATSALDNETQQIVSDNIEKLKATRIVIAHRLSTIIGADRIIVMDHGEIVEEGTYKELTEKEGLFHRLVKSQIL